MNTINHLKNTASIAGLIAMLALSGCVVVPAHRYAVREEIAVGLPVAGFVWYDGYWSHDHYGRHWAEGHWGAPRR